MRSGGRKDESISELCGAVVGQYLGCFLFILVPGAALALVVWLVRLAMR